MHAPPGQHPAGRFASAASACHCLAGAVHASHITEALTAARRIPAGMIWVNTYGRSLDVGSPFGGYKQSGFGKDFGVAAFDKYLKSKSVWVQLRQ